MADLDGVRVLGSFAVSSPPATSAPSTKITLSFLDIPWLFSSPMKRLFFYELPHPTLYVQNTVFPVLKRSLSLTLQHFFPFAGNLIRPPPPEKPYILHTQEDSVPLSLCQSTSCNFRQLISDYPQEANKLHPFIPKLGEPVLLPDGTHVLPLMAIQFTIFSNEGVSIGVCFRHEVADGMSFHHFMKSWTLMCKTGDPSCIQNSLPFLDRDVVNISFPKGKEVEQLWLQQWWTADSRSTTDSDHSSQLAADNVRVTFVLKKAQTDELKKWVSSQIRKKNEEPPLKISTFVVICSLVWICLIKSQEHKEDYFSENDEVYYFYFLADCRNRLGGQFPPTYFGNCLSVQYAQLKESELTGENGVLMATKVIGERVKELEEEAIKGPETWMTDAMKNIASGRMFSVAGSPRLKAYETDFGWGRPSKTEVVHIDTSGSISLNESREEEGGVQVGVALTIEAMARFTSSLEQSLTMLSSMSASVTVFPTSLSEG